IAVATGLFVLGYRAAARRVTTRWSGTARFTLPATGALLGVLFASQIAFWMFSGERVRSTALAGWVPWILLVGGAIAGAAGLHLAVRFQEGLERAALGANLAAAALLFGVAAAVVPVDLRVYVA